jgi:hypothetical protein
MPDYTELESQVTLLMDCLNQFSAYERILIVRARQALDDRDYIDRTEIEEIKELYERIA